MLPLQEQLTKIAELFPKFRSHLFPDGSPTGNSAQAPAPNALAGALQGQPPAPAAAAPNQFAGQTDAELADQPNQFKGMTLDQLLGIANQPGQ